MIFGNYQPSRRPRVEQPEQATVPQPRRAPAVKRVKQPFETLGNVLSALAVLAVVGALIAIVVGIADANDASMLVAAGLFGAAISCALGEVLVFIAQRLDEIARQGRGLSQRTE